MKIGIIGQSVRICIQADINGPPLYSGSLRIEPIEHATQQLITEGASLGSYPGFFTHKQRRSIDLTKQLS